MATEEREELKPLTFWEVLTSTFAAVIGVQSRANKLRDFSRGNIVHFIIAGVLFTAAFVGVMVAIVSLVLAS